MTSGFSSTTSTQKMRSDVSLQFLIILRRFGPLCPMSRVSIWVLVSDFLFMTDNGPVFLRAFCFVASPKFLFIRPPYVVLSLLHPSSFYDQFPRHIAVLVCPCFVCLPSQENLDRLQSNFFLQLLTLVLGCTFLPLGHHSLFLKHRPYVLRADHSDVHRHLFLKRHGVPSKVCHCGNLIPRSRVSHMTAQASPRTCLHVCTSKICFLHVICCSLLHLLIYTPSAQNRVAKVDKSSSAFESFTSVKM